MVELDESGKKQTQTVYFSRANENHNHNDNENQNENQKGN